MISPETAQRRIKKLEKYREQLWNKLKKYPTFKGYSYEEIRTIMNSKAELYEEMQENLFGGYHLEYRVYQSYQKYKHYKRKSTAYRHTANEFDNLSEKDVERLIKKYERKIYRYQVWEVRKELAGYEAEIEKLKQENDKVRKYNSKIYEKLSRTKDIQWKLVNKKIELEIEQGKDAIVKVDFKGLPATRFNGVMSGSIVYLSQFITREELEIARRNGKVKVQHGNLDSAIKHCKFRKDKPDNVKCVKCGKILEYNIIGVNKKLGRKQKKHWLCLDCLGMDRQHYISFVTFQKKRGCPLFV